VGLDYGQSNQGTKAMLKWENITIQAVKQLKEAKKRAAEEYPYMSDCHRYGKPIKEM